MLFSKEFIQGCVDSHDWHVTLGQCMAYNLNLKSCVDFSCGIGSCLEGVASAGSQTECEILGYECWDLSSDSGTEVPNNVCDRIFPGNFREPIRLARQYDCAIYIDATIDQGDYGSLVGNLYAASQKYIFILGSESLLKQLGRQLQKRGFNPVSDKLVSTYKFPPEAVGNTLLLVKDISNRKLVVNNRFGASPKIFHLHGRAQLNREGFKLKRDFFNMVAHNSSDLYRDIKTRKMLFPRIIDKHKTEAKEFNDRVTVALVSNYKELGSGVDCMKWLGYNHTVLGRDIIKFQHINKLERLCAFVQNHVKTEYTLYLDDPDLFVIDKLDDIIEKFEKFKCKLLFQADGWMYPRRYPRELCDYFAKLAPMDTPYKFLNSGAFMFRTEYYKSIIPKLLKKESYNPNVCQSVYMDLFPHEYPNIKLDYYAEIFQSTAYSQWFKDRYGKLDLKIEIK